MAPFTNISGCVSFFGKMSRLTLYVKIKLYHMIIHIFGKVQGPTATGNLHDKYLKTFLNVPILLKITNSTWFT